MKATTKQKTRKKNKKLIKENSNNIRIFRFRKVLIRNLIINWIMKEARETSHAQSYNQFFYVVGKATC